MTETRKGFSLRFSLSEMSVAIRMILLFAFQKSCILYYYIRCHFIVCHARIWEPEHYMRRGATGFLHHM